MGKRGIFNDEGELVEEYWEDETDDWYPSGCGDSQCDGYCQDLLVISSPHWLRLVGGFFASMLRCCLAL